MDVRLVVIRVGVLRRLTCLRLLGVVVEVALDISKYAVRDMDVNIMRHDCTSGEDSQFHTAIRRRPNPLGPGVR